MKKELLVPFCIVTIFIMAVSLALSIPVRAVGTAGKVTPGNCTESALDGALLVGGLVTFNCGVDPHTIILSGEKTIALDTTIDGGNLITLSGGNTAGLFKVNSGSTLNLKNLTLTNGSTSSGGAINNDGTVIITNVFLTNNLASGGIAGRIYNNGTLTITSSILSNNRTSGGSAGGIEILER